MQMVFGVLEGMIDTSKLCEAVPRMLVGYEDSDCLASSSKYTRL